MTSYKIETSRDEMIVMSRLLGRRIYDCKKMIDRLPAAKDLFAEILTITPEQDAESKRNEIAHLEAEISELETLKAKIDAAANLGAWMDD